MDKRYLRRSVPHPSQPERENTVQQAPAAAADLNKLVAKHTAPGGPGRFGIPLGNPNATVQPRWMDMPSMSFHEMLNQVADVQNKFGSLPARIRSRFNNSPYQLLRFVEDPSNRAECLRLGLVEPTEAEYDALRAVSPRSVFEYVNQTSMPDPDPNQVAPSPEAAQAPRPDPEANPRPTPKGGRK